MPRLIGSHSRPGSRDAGACRSRSHVAAEPSRISIIFRSVMGLMRMKLISFLANVGSVLHLLWLNHLHVSFGRDSTVESDIAAGVFFEI
jgi:hypothetical protein